MNTIPVIDIAPFLNGTAQEQETVAREVDRACSSLGFLIISGHGVPESQIEDMRSVSRAYFDRPLEEKLKLRMPPDRYRGYISLGSEALSYSLDEESPPDFKNLSRSGRPTRPTMTITAPPSRESSSPRTSGRKRRPTFARCGRPISPHGAGGDRTDAYFCGRFGHG